MVRKFIKIQKIGRFKNFSASGDISLDRVNIIYGENSQGKTTLVSILRSLFLKNPELIRERKTFGSGTKQQIVELFLQDNNNRYLTFTFKNDSWSSDINEDIEIFDDFFINENIYTGLEIQSDHQKHLFQFAVGKEAVRLAKGIERIKEDLNSKKHPQLNSLEEQLSILTKGHFSVEKYVNLPKDSEIDQDIEKTRHEIKIAEESEEIKRKGKLKEAREFSLPLDLNEIKKVLNKSLDTISEEALHKTNEHIDKLSSVLQDEAETWLHRGLSVVENIKENKCPFCQQDLRNAKDVIQFYQQYFNKEHKNLKKETETLKSNIQHVNIDQLFYEVERTILENKGLLEFWKKFLSVNYLEFQGLDNCSQRIMKYFEEIKSAIDNKFHDILTSISSESVDKLSESIKAFNKEIEEYNLKIRELNRQIEDLKKKQPNLENLKKELKKLEIAKQRFSPENDDLCKQYTNLKKKIENKQKLIEQKKKKLNEVVSEQLEEYGKETNRILEKFGVPFKILKPKHKYRGKGKEPYLEYLIEVDGYQIKPLQETKYTLSGGDKNALALAFFLAKIFVDGNIKNKNIKNKIVIFDDPMSSFDYNRKRRTIEFIKEVSKSSKQTIILTHINTFAFQLYDSLRDRKIKPKCLQVINGAVKEWNINEEKKHPFFKNIKKLETLVSGEKEINLEEARRLIRICLEDKLKFNYFQFFKELGEEYWLGTMIEKLRKINDDEKLKFKHSNKEEVIKELGNLCDFSSSSHHSNIMSQYKTDYTHDEIVNYVKSTLKMIYEWL